MTTLGRASVPLRQRALAALRVLAICVGVGVACTFVAGMVALAAWPPINDVRTGETPEYPDLQPRAYRFSQPRVFAAAEESIVALEGFALVSADGESGTLEATAESRTGWFTDDVTIDVQANGEGGAIVFIRSRSRVGRGDFGQNARNVRALQAAMDANLGVGP